MFKITPLTYKGVEVGTAEINFNDGWEVKAHISESTPEGQMLNRMLKVETLSGLSIGPRFTQERGTNG